MLGRGGHRLLEEEGRVWGGIPLRLLRRAAAPEEYTAAAASRGCGRGTGRMGGTARVGGSEGRCCCCSPTQAGVCICGIQQRKVGPLKELKERGVGRKVEGGEGDGIGYYEQEKS